jgi:hemerythrin-like metal-binding domain
MWSDGQNTADNQTDRAMNRTFEPNEVSLTWSDAHLLGYGPMDEAHKEFYSVAVALLKCNSHNALEAVAAFERHAVEHFKQEEQWMLETNFPSRNCHIEEHGAVLSSVYQVRETIAAGDLDIRLAHDLAYHLLRWFPGHTDYLDSALASWLTRIKHGGNSVIRGRREFSWFGP